jgi:hypothetical protein
LEIDPAAAADAVRARAACGLGGPVSITKQLGREELRGGAASGAVMSAADAEEASWRGFCMPNLQLVKPRPQGSGGLAAAGAASRNAPAGVSFANQLGRLPAVSTGWTAAVTAGHETGDVDAGLYDPRHEVAVWPTAAAAHFTFASRPTLGGNNCSSMPAVNVGNVNPATTAVAAEHTHRL